VTPVLFPTGGRGVPVRFGIEKGMIRVFGGLFRSRMV
jgi:hypothetical protein